MSESKPSAILTQANPFKVFPAGPLKIRPISTSGVIGASPATVKLQQKNALLDDWVDNPNLEFLEGVHISGVLTSTARYNQIVVVTPDSNTLVNVQL